MEVVEFFSKLMGLWSELESFANIPKCRYGLCTSRIEAKVVS